jgi:hypothetical protein
MLFWGVFVMAGCGALGARLAWWILRKQENPTAVPPARLQ